MSSTTYPSGLKSTFMLSIEIRRAGKELQSGHYKGNGAKSPDCSTASYCGQRHLLHKGLRGVRSPLSIHSMNIQSKPSREPTDHRPYKNQNCKWSMSSQKGPLIYYAPDRWTKVSALYYITVSVRFGVMITSALLVQRPHFWSDKPLVSSSYLNSLELENGSFPRPARKWDEEPRSAFGEEFWLTT